MGASGAIGYEAATLARMLAKEKKFAGVRVASEFADSGSGTHSDPYINGIQEAYDDAVADNINPVVFLNGHFKATHAIVFNSSAGLGDSYAIFGTGGNRCTITTANDVAFNLFELNETEGAAMGYLSDFKTNYNGLGVVIKNYNLTELYMRGMEVRADRVHDGLLVFNPTLQNLTYNQIEQCYFLEGGDAAIAQIQFKKPAAFQTTEILISECFMQASYEAGVGFSGIIEVDDDALDRWAITSCRWKDIGYNPLMNIKGKIGNGGFGGVHPIEIGGVVKVDAKSRLIHFNDLVAGHNAHVKISGLQVKQHSTLPAKYGVYIGNNWNYIDVTDNTLPGFATEAIHVSAGANQHGRIENNVAANPFGVTTNPFDTANDLIHLTGDAPSPTASIDYTICFTPCRIISTDSGNANCNITVKDVGGNIIETGLSTYDNWVEPGWTINWGAFTGVPPTVIIAFK